MILPVRLQQLCTRCFTRVHGLMIITVCVLDRFSLSWLGNSRIRHHSSAFAVSTTSPTPVCIATDAALIHAIAHAQPTRPSATTVSSPTCPWPLRATTASWPTRLTWVRTSALDVLIWAGTCHMNLLRCRALQIARLVSIAQICTHSRSCRSRTTLHDLVSSCLGDLKAIANLSLRCSAFHTLVQNG